MLIILDQATKDKFWLLLKLMDGFEIDKSKVMHRLGKTIRKLTLKEKKTLKILLEEGLVTEPFYRISEAGSGFVFMIAKKLWEVADAEDNSPE